MNIYRFVPCFSQIVVGLALDLLLESQRRSRCGRARLEGIVINRRWFPGLGFIDELIDPGFRRENFLVLADAEFAPGYFLEVSRVGNLYILLRSFKAGPAVIALVVNSGIGQMTGLMDDGDLGFVDIGDSRHCRL